MPVSRSDKFNPRGALGGILVLVGGFCVVCAPILLAAAGWRLYREHTMASRWVETRAVIRKCRLDIYHPFVRDGGGTTYSLACRVAYAFAAGDYETDFHTRSDRSQQIGGDIEEWVEHHPPGSAMRVRVNPRNPAEVAAMGELPLEQFNTSWEALVTGIAMAAGGVLIFALGRRLVK